MQPARIVVVGASAGGVTALLDLVGGLPATFGAPVCVVLHVGQQASVLPELMQRRGALPARHAQHGEELHAGTVYIAPPDRHLLVDATTLRLDRGPRENFARPAIDPLFRSAALHWRERSIGLILSGNLDDGVAGLCAISDCGGVTIVQDPLDAACPEMPKNALAAVDVDHVVGLAQMPRLLEQLIGQPPPRSANATAQGKWACESAVFNGENPLDNLATIADPSTLTCPDCGGVLWQLSDGKPQRYRCHTGHAFSSMSLDAAQQRCTQDALWTALRALQEREFQLRRLAAATHAAGDAEGAAIGQAKADHLRDRSAALRGMIEDTAGA